MTCMWIPRVSEKPEFASARRPARTLLPVEPNSVVYWFGTHPSNPSIIVANSLHGYVYLSTDAGHTWTKLRREFGEIRALTWMPK
jgi:hypothetical protein